VRAIQITEFGGPEVLRPAELPVPEPNHDEVLIKVSRAGLNFADTHTTSNSYVRKATLPLVPGAEVAGTLVDSGERVVALTWDGGYAEYATARREHTFPIGDAIDDGTALALLIQGTTAWHLYRTAGCVAEGESVVVGSAAGGVGSLAVQLGAPLGAGRVIATATSEPKRAVALEQGADAAVDGAAEGLTERLLEANGGRPVDVVFDMAGGDVFDACFDALAHFGRIVVCGIAGEKRNHPSTGALLRHSRAVVGFYLFHCLERPPMFAHALADLMERAAAGELRVIVGATYPLTQAAQAHEDMRARHTTGKLLLDPARDP
jgi:NADPH2:quinone reductase